MSHAQAMLLAARVRKAVVEEASCGGVLTNEALGALVEQHFPKPKPTYPKHRNNMPCEDCDPTQGCTMNCSK